MLKDLLVKNMIIYLSMLHLQKDNDVFFSVFGNPIFKRDLM